MQRIRRIRQRRGALEGLPLYLIILIVVAAIVVAILVGWLTTLQHPGISGVAVNLDGNPGFQSISCPASGACTGSSANFISNGASGTCTFDVYTSGAGSGGYALIVSITDKSGNALSGVTVTLSSSIQFTATPSDTVSTGSSSGLGSGDAGWNSISGTVPANDNAGGSILVTASYSSGGVTSTGTASIPIEPPTTTSTGASLSC
jgi:hypothetical protein